MLELFGARGQRDGDSRIVIQPGIGAPLGFARNAARSWGTEDMTYSTSSGHGTMVDFTVFIAIASLTACATPASVNG